MSFTNNENAVRWLIDNLGNFVLTEKMELENPKKDKLLDALYEVCTDRTLTSEKVFYKIIEKLQLMGVEHIKEKAIEVIRPYKNTGKNLEETLNKLYDVVYPNDGNSWSGRRE